MAYSKQVTDRLKDPVKKDEAALRLINLELAKRNVERTQNYIDELVASIHIVHESELPLSESLKQSMSIGKQTPNISKLLELTEPQLDAASAIFQRLQKTDAIASELDQSTFDRIIAFAKNSTPEMATRVSNVMVQMRVHGIPIKGNRRELLELKDFQLDYLHNVLLQLDEGKNLDANSFKVLLRYAQGMTVNPEQTVRDIEDAEVFRNKLIDQYQPLDQEYTDKKNIFRAAENEYNTLYTELVQDPDNRARQRREVRVSDEQAGALVALDILRAELVRLDSDLIARREVLNNQNTEIDNLIKARDSANTSEYLGKCINTLLKSGINLNYALGGSRLESLIGLERQQLRNINHLLVALSTGRENATDKNNYLDDRTFDFIMKEMGRKDSAMHDNRRIVIAVFNQMRERDVPIPIKGCRQELLTMSETSLLFLRQVLDANNAVDASTFAILRKSASKLTVEDEQAYDLGTAVKELMSTMKTHGISNTEWRQHDKLSKIIELPEASIKHINSIFLSLATAEKNGVTVRALDKRTAHYIINNAATIGVEKLEAIADVFKFMQKNCSEAIIGNRQPLMKLDRDELVVLLAEMKAVINLRDESFEMDAKQVRALINEAKASKVELYNVVRDVQAVEGDNPASKFREQVKALAQNQHLVEKSEDALKEHTDWKSKFSL